ncbi:probable histone-lysine N-methyltransferase SMYD3 at N-terminal half [Coccomyxa sp. Obi]|nr:probable histone-lysine N-methyltransferase SMYD3 at N-terminal half [Coccomyxa sp. Obi]
MMKVDGRVLKDSLELRYAEGRGYHVRAKQRLVAGSVVLEEKPCAVALSESAADQLCRACLMIIPPKLREDPIKCIRCNLAWYCSQRCRTRDTGPHQATGECNLLQYPAIMKELGMFARETCLALRLLQCKRGEPPLQSNWDKFIGPQSGDDAHLLCTAAKAVVQAAKAAVEGGVAGAVSREEKAAAEAVCQVFTNALEVLPSMPVACACDAQSFHTGQPAIAMYSLISRLNHSCRSNTAYHFKAGGAIVVRAVVDIDPGEELCISYLDPIQPLSRREEDLRQRFCFVCSCDRCASERQALRDEAGMPSAAHCNRAGTAEGGEHEGEATVVPRVPTWFLSAVAPPSREEEANSLMMGLSRQARVQFVQQGNAPAAWAALEPGILQAMDMGVHPYHYRCLDLYACLTSTCRVCAKLGAGRVALPRAAMYALLQAGAAEAVLAVGEYGAMPHAARNWSEAGGLLCEVLAAELAHLRHAAGQGTPPAAKNMETSLPSNAEPSLQRRVRGTEKSGAHDVHMAAPTDAQQPQNGVASRKRSASPAHETLSTTAAHQPAGEAAWHRSKRSRVAGSCGKAEEARGCTVQWPDLLEGASFLQAGPQSDAKSKSIPEPPADLAAAVCAAWAALSADSEPEPGRQASTEEGGTAAAEFSNRKPGQQDSAVEGGTATAEASNKSSADVNLPENKWGAERGSAREVPQLLRLIADGKSAEIPAAEAEASVAGQDTGTCSSVEHSGPAQAPSTSKTDERHPTGASHEGPCRSDMQEGVEGPSLAQQLWPNACRNLQALAGPAGFLCCNQAPPVNEELRFALHKEISGLGQAEREVERLEHIGMGAILCMAHATRLLRVTAGAAHPMTESNTFCAFFVGLPYSVASIISRAASQLSC